MKRKSVLQVCGAVALAAACGLMSPLASAQGSWPSRPIRIEVPYPPGTGPDVMARLVGEGLSKELKASVVVENKAGANGIIGTAEVVKAPADGYTYLLVDRLTLTVNPLLYQPPYDPKKDLVSVSNIADVNLYLVTSAQLPANDFKSFIAYAKANPGKVTFGTGGVGSVMHLNMELLESGTGVKFLHVPYKALAEVIPAMLGGQVEVTSGGVEAMLPYVQKGSFKLLAVGAPTRQAIVPNVPTIAEAGGSDMLLSTSYSFHAKSGVPPEILARMNAALTKVLAQPELKRWAAERGLGAGASTPAELDARIAVDNDRIGRLVRERGIKVQ
ncbi:Bug family tripartite tricarboxylate transporter substrate binding protein [Variovorax guangxiensis]|uniref:Tripartite-type tricarboxylate transporter receptor subunit TctC n=1 Tax=Variovorax guangxiensis TaxID=1775474 RepID=A0A840G0Z6_9BURK|nr:tripartite tricarboxylate transporter substrate binding protein [Variovorax guangxiensis]MBB4224967.1 tripartite-type tricarboxylate transporter receptor subunit TctC [Variovorax guangxiensis]